MEARKIKAAEIVRGGEIRQRSAHLWLVPSQSHKGTWLVDYEYGNPTCTCPDFKERLDSCKHIFAVEMVKEHHTVPTEKRKKYSQNWPIYNQARRNEGKHFFPLLKDLCSGISIPRQVGKGRPSVPLNDLIFACVVKVYHKGSGLAVNSLIEALQEQGLMSVAPAPNTISDAFNKKELTPLLRELVHQSAMPLAGIERAFSADSTGFGTRTYHRWIEEKHGKGKQRAQFRKAHAMGGNRTHIVADVIVSDEGDATQFKPLIDEVSKRFNIEEIAADKAYLSKNNLLAAEAIGAVPYIPFKIGTGGSGGPAVWQRMYHFAQCYREEFEKHYHQRSNIEAIFAMVKARTGFVRSKSRNAQLNEVYCKFIVHNICVLIMAIYELGIAPKFWQNESA